MQRGLRALPLVFMMTTGSTHVFGQQLTCYAIRRGDTAAGLAQRLTGYASNRHQALVSDCRPDDLDLRSEIPVRRHPVGMARVRPARNAESLVRPACVVSDKSQAGGGPDRLERAVVGRAGVHGGFSPRAHLRLEARRQAAGKSRRHERVRRPIHFRVRTAAVSQRCRFPGQVAVAIRAGAATDGDPARACRRAHLSEPFRPPAERRVPTFSVCCGF